MTLAHQHLAILDPQHVPSNQIIAALRALARLQRYHLAIRAHIHSLRRASRAGDIGMSIAA